jgi:hypothetical protein
MNADIFFSLKKYREAIADAVRAGPRVSAVKKRMNRGPTPTNADSFWGQTAGSKYLAQSNQFN